MTGFGQIPEPHCTLPAFLGGCTLLQSRCDNRQMERGLKCIYSSSTLYRTYRFNNHPITVFTAVLQLAEAHDVFLPLTYGWPGSYHYSCCSSLWQSTPSKPQGFITAMHCLGCPWKASRNFS